MFDLSNITLAFVQSHDAAMSFDAMTADMLQWNAAGVYPSNQEVIAALVAAGRWGKGTCEVYASNLIKWAKSGQTPRNISQVVKGKPDGHVKAKAGRKAGQGAGKTTKPADDAAQAAPETVPNDDAAWLRFINDMRSKVNGRKDWPADRIVAFQDTTATLIALLKSVQK